MIDIYYSVARSIGECWFMTRTIKEVGGQWSQEQLTFPSWWQVVSLT